MNALEMLDYGHRDVLRAFDGLTDAEWARVGVTSRWNPRQLLAHLVANELLLAEVLGETLSEGSTPTLDAMRSGRGDFNEDQVAARAPLPPAELMREYEVAHVVVMDRATRLGAARLAEPGTIPWYGPTYSLDDLVVYTNYAHKREHCGQMKVFRSRSA